MRSDGIEIRININQIPQDILDSEVLDIEYSSEKGYDILWIHDDGFKPFLEEHFQHLSAAISAYNRKTQTDHLNIYLETQDELDEYGESIDDVKYRNIRFSELGATNLAEVKFKRNLKNK